MIVEQKNIKDLLDLIRSQSAYQAILGILKNKKAQPGLALPRSARLAVTATLHADLNCPMVLVTDRSDHAMAVFDELSFWMPSVPLFYFSEPNPLFYEESTWGKDTRRERLRAITALAAYHFPFGKERTIPPVIVASARAIMLRTLPRRDFLKATVRLEKNGAYQLENLVKSCLMMGYEISDTVFEPGQICRRGGLLDIWPIPENNPTRLEFFGNILETIYSFDPASQRTTEKLASILVTPACEFLLPEIATMKNGRSSHSEFDIPILHPHTSSLFDYLPNNSTVLIDDLSLFESTVEEFEELAIKLRDELEKDGLVPKEFPVPYYSWMELFDKLQPHIFLELGQSTAEITNGGQSKTSALAPHFGLIERFSGRLKAVFSYIEMMIKKGFSVILVSRQSSRLRDLWLEQNYYEETPCIFFFEASLSGGWLLGKCCLLTDSEVFGWERPQPRKSRLISADTPEIAFADLSIGDWVVHVDYGIGKFLGLVRRTLDGYEREFLCVEFRNNDQVFVPIHQADRLSRYIGSDNTPPSLGHLGTQEWSETKHKVREAVQEVAKDLLELFARRQLAQGYAFKSDTVWQNELESSFPYAETPDQITALKEIKEDMEAARPMDRLLCGDVGYGKTEIALRAAFKAVMDGKQVAILVPTTVLAQQHFDTFRERLSAFPVLVEMLSRFRTRREQDQILHSLLHGTVDIVIGTHRLISSDVKFKDLGLVVIDEEQRFGVTHKEHFKRLRTEIDVLTLTATPIPRTLYMALVNVRDISNLNTPPEERLPIITHIGPYSPKLVRQAVLRELERGGQTFFVHNRVQTIHAMKLHLEKLVPEARIEIGHGQMPEHELASVMHRFNSGDIDILLSTSIIESGLDIPNANTLIVDRGDTFGLAQLYQLRGRVGRGAVRAYAYFFRHRKFSPTPEGQERLETIAENTNLGAGYSIAMRDLEMRGAGELLGTRQSGYISAVGFHLYSRLLAMAVQNLRSSSKIDETTPGRYWEIGIPVNVDLPLAASIPDAYIPDQSLRLRLYRRLADLTDESSLEALREEFTDRFGSLPEPVGNLFFQALVKIRAERARITSINSESGQLALRYTDTQLHEERENKHLLDIMPGVRRGKYAYWYKFGDDVDWRAQLLQLLGILENR